MDPDRFSGTSPDPVDEGAELVIDYSNPARANETISVTVGDGAGHEQQVDIVLDANGHGQHGFIVPSGWFGVTLNFVDSAEHVVSVNP